MNNKLLILFVAVLVAVLGIFSIYALNQPSAEERVTLNVSSEGPYELSILTDNIRNHEYYRGYDPETLAWMESLGDKWVWNSNNGFVIMDKWDADKLNSAYVLDAYFYEIFSCNVLENHSLGNTKYPKEILLVNNVEFIREEMYYYDV
ncbi:hypothetical protein [Methanobrevibacter sp.]